MIYLDHHAASPIDEGARAAMEEARARAWANPSSVHAAGRAAKAVLERAREQIAAAICASPADIVLTSGGTEACNLALFGLYEGGTIVTTPIEHPAVSEPIAELERRGASVIRTFDAVAAPFAAIQWVNHETGRVLAPRSTGRLFVDATQALGKIPIDVSALGATAIALASSKIGGPPGAGALWIARDAGLRPSIVGGAQERGRRAGTPDPAAHAGFGVACTKIAERIEAMAAIAARRDRLEAALVALGAVVNDEGPRVATVTNVSVRGWKGQSLVAALDLEGVCASSGAACSSGVDEPSPVIRALRPGEPWRAESALRLSLGPSTTDAEIDVAIEVLRRVIGRKKTSGEFSS